MIEPALTPEEWANRETSDAYVDRDGKLWCRSDCGGEPYAEDYEPNRLGLAHLPDDCRCSLVVGSGDMTVGELRSALASCGGQRDMTARELAAEFGHSRELKGQQAPAQQPEGETRE